MSGTAPRRQGVVTPRLILGLTLIAIGVIYSLDRLGYADAEQWIRWWPLVLVVAGLGKLLFPGSSSSRLTGFILTAIGIWMLSEEIGWIAPSFWDWWPLVLVAFGLRLVFQGYFGGRRAAADDDGSVNGLAMLGGGSRSKSTADFRGGDLVAFMGGIDVDLRKSAIQQSPAVIDAFAFWGGIDIKVPEDWLVTLRGIPILGAFEDSTRPPTDDEIVGPVQEVVIKGFAIMGGVEIKN